jgi:hypothetical protein
MFKKIKAWFMNRVMQFMVNATQKALREFDPTAYVRAVQDPDDPVMARVSWSYKSDVFWGNALELGKVKKAQNAMKLLAIFEEG